MEPSKRTESIVSLTPAAAEKIRALLADETDVSVLRVAIEGGGCSGFQYGLGFDRGAQEGDHEFECEGVKRRRRPLQRAVSEGARSTTSRPSRSPGSRSTTRTPSPRAAAGTPSRSPRARLPKRAPTAAAPAAPTDAACSLGMALPCASRRRLRPGRLLRRRARSSRADPPVEVDMIERLPTPWGLVRLGVAPDHPKLKSVSRAFERIAERPGFRFLGNVEVGRDLTPTTSRASTTRSSTPSARRPTGGSASPARICRVRGRPPSSSPGTTATPTSRTSRSTSTSSGPS